MGLRSMINDFIMNSVWPGLGLLGESYMLFSLGTLQPLLAIFGLDSSMLLLPLMLGVINGMLFFGIIAQTTGRRAGSICTSAFMWTGSMGMFLTSLLVGNDGNTGTNGGGMMVVFGLSLTVLGFGVGGEYPMAAASASEQSNIGTHRGKHVQLIFSMQGIGILLHCLILWVLFLIMGDDVQDRDSMILVWRLVYFVGVLLLTVVFITRILHLKESPAWEEDQRKSAELVHIHEGHHKPHTSSPKVPGSVSSGAGGPTIPSNEQIQNNMEVGYPVVATVSSLSIPSVAVVHDDAEYHLHTENHNPNKYKLGWKLYGSRLAGAAAAWFLWDVAFYGNKLFQSAFLLALTGEETTLTEGAGAATLNAAVAASGYLTAAFVIDRVGYWRLQLVGFLITGLLFLLTGLFLDVLDGNKAGLVMLYLGSSYFGQVGPNATTFVLPAEVIPTAWRTMAHGIAAASGKLGALVATLVFHSSDNTTDLFLWSGYASLLGAIATYWLVPYESSPQSKAQTNHQELLDQNWRKAASGQPFVVPADSVYERLIVRRQNAHANGNYLTSDFHEAVYD